MQKPHELLAEVGANEVAAPYKLAVELPRLGWTPSVVRIRCSLPQRRFVVHTANSLNQIIVEVADSYLEAAFLGASHVFPGFLRQAFPPFSKTNHVDHGYAFALG
ncbi:MAG: hypothetical protein WBW31_18385 [Candidatus Sulfotelmatobacter sp.]